MNLYFFYSDVIKDLTTRHRHLPDANSIVRITSEQGLSVGGPSQRQALRWFSFAVLSDDFGFEFLDHFFAFEIPNLDPWSERGAKPVAVWTEAQGSDDVVMIKGVQMFAIIQIPQHGLAVLFFKQNSNELFLLNKKTSLINKKKKIIKTIY